MLILFIWPSATRNPVCMLASTQISPQHVAPETDNHGQYLTIVIIVAKLTKQEYFRVFQLKLMIFFLSTNFTYNKKISNMLLGLFFFLNFEINQFYNDWPVSNFSLHFRYFNQIKILTLRCANNYSFILKLLYKIFQIHHKKYNQVMYKEIFSTMNWCFTFSKR